jgi:palmitoyltransferase
MQADTYFGPPSPNFQQGPPPSPLPGIIALLSFAVILYTGFVFDFVYLGRMLPALGKDSYVIPYALIFNVPWGLALWSYGAAMLSDPGYLPPTWVEFVQSVGDALPIYDTYYGHQPGKATHCGKCSMPRPERAHHCKVCDFCVLRMDHHCPWINNCVGFNNHKFFLLLCFYGALAGIVSSLLTLPEVIFIFGSMLDSKGLGWVMHFTMEQGVYFVQEPFPLSKPDSIAFFTEAGLGMVCAVLLNTLLLQHLNIATQNLTTIEDNYGKVGGNPFDLGSSLANLEQVFGAWGPDWFLPVTPLTPVADGVAFPPFDDCIGPNGMPKSFPNGMPNGNFIQPEDIWILRYGVRPRQPAFMDTGVQMSRRGLCI